MQSEQLEAQQAQQSLVEHLTDLRKAVIYSVIFFLLCFIGILLYINKVIPLITNDHKLVMLGPLDVIRFYTGIAGSLSLGLSAPFIGYQVWRFAKPALTEQESKTALTFIPSLFISFIVGLTFGAFVIFPTVYSFLMSLGVKNFEIMITAKEYFSFLMMTTIPLGFLFEIPLLFMFLTSIGIVTPMKLKEVRKYGYLLMAVVSALITPPDFFSQLMVLFPLMMLYEAGILLSKVSYKKRQKKLTEAEEDSLLVEPNKA